MRFTPALVCAAVALQATQAASLDGGTGATISGWRFGEMFEVDALEDADGVDVIDVNGDGRLDIVASGGRSGDVYWYEQGANPKSWTKHTIWDNADGSIDEIEGTAAADFTGEGQISVVSADQKNGNIVLHHHSVDPAGLWSLTVIQENRPWVHAVIAIDLDDDGNPEIVYAWEGSKAGEGGVHWLKLAGDDPTIPGNWTDHAMAAHEGAWALRVASFVDISGDGNLDNLVFSARNQTNRNPATSPGLFYLTRPDDPIDPWPKTLIGNTPNDTINFDIGDFHGDMTGRDVVACDLAAGQVFIFRAADEWARTDLSMPSSLALGPVSRGWNVKRLPGTVQGYDSILAAVSTPTGSALQISTTWAGPMGCAGSSLLIIFTRSTTGSLPSIWMMTGARSW